MKYDNNYFHDQLITLQNTDFESYKDLSEFDVLIQLVNSETIFEFNEINWYQYIHHFLHIESECTRNDCIDYVVEDNKLERTYVIFTNRGVRIKFLLFLQSNQQDILYQFNNPEFVEKECARLISFEIKDSARDEYHGEFAKMPRPNYAELIKEPDIFNKKTFVQRWTDKMLEDRCKILEQQNVQNELLLDLNANATAILYKFIDDCSDASNYCPTPLVLQEAKDIYLNFSSSKVYNTDAWKYIDAIYERFKGLVNSGYWRKTPAYQVMATLYVMLLTTDDPSLQQLSFANNIGNVVFKRDNFAGTIEMADEAIRLIKEAKSQYNIIKDDARGKNLIEILEENRNLSEQVDKLQKSLDKCPSHEDMNKLQQQISNLQLQLANYENINDNYVSIEKLFSEAAKMDDVHQLSTIKDFFLNLDLDPNRIKKLKVDPRRLVINQLNMGNGIQSSEHHKIEQK